MFIFEHLNGLKIRCYILFSMMLTPFIRINDNQYFFISMGGKSKGGNPKSFFNYVQSVAPNAKLIWGCHKILRSKANNEVPLGSFRYYFYLFSSKYIISDFRLSYFALPYKRTKQLYVQTWHGTALKRIEAAAPSLPDSYVKNAKRDSRMIDIFISSSTYMTKIYQTDFWYGKKIYEIGSPRNDIFFVSNKTEIRDKVCRKLGISGSKKILLYAPTFRNGKDSFLFYDIDVENILMRLKSKFSGDFVLVIRLHPYFLTKVDSERRIKEMFPLSIDATMYDDIQELLLSTDVLITDYSSCMFDFMLTGKPCFLYTKDVNTYDRGFYFDIGNLPFPANMDNAALLNEIESFSYKDYNAKVKDFLSAIGNFDKGSASMELYKLIHSRS